MKDKDRKRPERPERKTISISLRITPTDMARARLAEKKLSSVELSTSRLLLELIRLGTRTALAGKQESFKRK